MVFCFSQWLWPRSILIQSLLSKGGTKLPWRYIFFQFIDFFSPFEIFLAFSCRLSLWLVNPSFSFALIHNNYLNINPEISQSCRYGLFKNQSTRLQFPSLVPLFLLASCPLQIHYCTHQSVKGGSEKKISRHSDLLKSSDKRGLPIITYHGFFFLFVFKRNLSFLCS